MRIVQASGEKIGYIGTLILIKQTTQQYQNREEATDIDLLSNNERKLHEWDVLLKDGYTPSRAENGNSEHDARDNDNFCLLGQLVRLTTNVLKTYREVVYSNLYRVGFKKVLHKREEKMQEKMKMT